MDLNTWQKSRKQSRTTTTIMYRLADFNLPPSNSRQNPEIGLKLLCHLATPSCPPCGFWVRTQYFRKQLDSIGFSCNSIHPIHSTIIHELKCLKQLPLPGFLAKIQIWCVSNPKNTLVLCLHPKNWFPLQFFSAVRVNSLEFFYPRVHTQFHTFSLPNLSLSQS